MKQKTAKRKVTKNFVQLIILNDFLRKVLQDEIRN